MGTEAATPKNWPGIRAAVLPVALALALSACGGSSPEPTRSSDSENVGSTAPAKAGTVKQGAFGGSRLVWATTGGLYQDAQEQAFMEPFAREAGAKVIADGGATDMGKLSAMVSSGNVTWDVMTNADFAVAAQCGSLYQKIDRAQVDVSRLIPSLVGDCGVPTDLGPTYLVYNEQRFGDDPPTSYADFFDVAKYPGKRAVLAIPALADPTLFEMALLADGVEQDDLYPLDIDRALRKLDTIRDHLILAPTNSRQQQVIESGQADMAWMAGARTYASVRNGAPFARMTPDFIAYTIVAAVPKGVKDPSASMALINYAVGPGPAAKFTELTLYPGANLDADPKLPPAKAAWVPSTNELKDEAHTHFVNGQYWAEHYEEIMEKYTAWINK